MAKIDLAEISSGYNITKVNENFQAIEDELNNNVLYRDNPDDEDNALESDIDANDHRILNLPAPLSASEPIRLQEFEDIEGTLKDYVEEAEGYRDEVIEAANEVEVNTAIASAAAESAEDSALQAEVTLGLVEAVAVELGSLINTGEWSADTEYMVGAIWQHPTDLDWYYVLSTYTSDSSDPDVDVASGNVSLYSGSISSYNYVTVNTILGDKLTYNSPLFDDVDVADIALGLIVEGSSTPQIDAAYGKLDEQLGFLVEGEV